MTKLWSSEFSCQSSKRRRCPFSGVQGPSLPSIPFRPTAYARPQRLCRPSPLLSLRGAPATKYILSSVEGQPRCSRTGCSSTQIRPPTVHPRQSPSKRPHSILSPSKGPTPAPSITSPPQSLPPPTSHNPLCPRSVLSHVEGERGARQRRRGPTPNASPAKLRDSSCRVRLLTNGSILHRPLAHACRPPASSAAKPRQT